MENIKNDKKISIAILFFIIAFIIIILLIANGNMQDFDTTISNFVINIIPGNFAYFLEIITNLGGIIFLPVIALILSLLLIINGKKYYGYCMIVNMLLSSTLYLTIKTLVQRPRPETFRFITETGYSFPSGHATNNVAFYGLLIYFIFKNVKNKILKTTLITILVIWMSFIALSRIYFNVHYPSDVIAGIILGIICVLICVKIFKKTFKIKEYDV